MWVVQASLGCRLRTQIPGPNPHLLRQSVLIAESPHALESLRSTALGEHVGFLAWVVKGPSATGVHTSHPQDTPERPTGLQAFTLFPSSLAPNAGYIISIIIAITECLVCVRHWGLYQYSHLFMYSSQQLPKENTYCCSLHFKDEESQVYRVEVTHSRWYS